TRKSPKISARLLLGAAQERADRCFELLSFEFAAEDVADDALPVDDGGMRQGSGIVGVQLRYFQRRLHAVQNGIVYSRFFGETSSCVTFVDGNADDLQALRAQFALQLHEHRHFPHAGRAPGGPEVENDDLAVPLRDRLQLVVQVRQLGQRAPARLGKALRLVVIQVAPDAGAGADDSGDDDGGGKAPVHSRPPNAVRTRAAKAAGSRKPTTR